MDDRQPYDKAHGVCLHHIWGLGDAQAEVALRVARARVAIVAWELEEAYRKQRWDSRHEPHGGETDAWRRAPAVIDGRVYEGGPARPLA